MMPRNWWTAITSRKFLRREHMPTELTESKAERCSVFSYSVLRSCVHGSGLPHLAAATHQRYDRVSRPRRKYLDYHPIDRECVITFTVSGWAQSPSRRKQQLRTFCKGMDSKNRCVPLLIIWTKGMTACFFLCYSAEQMWKPKWGEKCNKNRR